ncbi:MAG: ABC transporter ATP-binding protein [Bacteroidales bacterium]|nr:ABC transporter ATP-binding protein [Bacteroidales bacterium]
MSDFKKIRSLIKPYRLNAFLSVFFNSSSVIFAIFSYTMVIPFLRILFNPDKLVSQPVEFSFSTSALQHNMFYLLSRIIESYGKVEALIFVSGVIVIASLFKNGFLYMHKYFMAPLMNGVARDYQRKLFAKFVGLRLGFFTDEKKGNLMSRITNDVMEVRQSSQHILVLMFTGPISVVLYMAFLFYSSWQLTIFVLVFLPIMGFIIIRVSRSLKGQAYLGQQVQGDILSSTEENISGLRIIKAFNAEKKVISGFNIITQKYFTVMNKVERKVWLASPLSEVMATVIIMVIMYVGGILVMGDGAKLTSEAFIAYLVVFSQVIPPAKATINAYYSIQKGMAAVKRIDEVLNAEEKIVNSQNPVFKKDFETQVNYKNVSFFYEDDRNVLKNINIEVNKGETVAIVGESGSGKSTMVDLLPRFYDIQQGEILIDGVNVKNIDLVNLRNLFGVVSQTSILFNDTIEGNIAFGVDKYTKEDLFEAAKIANAYDFIMEKPEGFKTNIGDGGGKLSGGQRQRISIARAVLKNPPILILDEATSALDTESEKLVQDALNNIMQSRTAIVIAHRLSTVKNADRIYVMSEGKVIEQGKHTELIELGGVYKRLVDMQMV